MLGNCLGTKKYNEVRTPPRQLHCFMLSRINSEKPADREKLVSSSLKILPTRNLWRLPSFEHPIAGRRVAVSAKSCSSPGVATDTPTAAGAATTGFESAKAWLKDAAPLRGCVAKECGTITLKTTKRTSESISTFPGISIVRNLCDLAVK